MLQHVGVPVSLLAQLAYLLVVVLALHAQLDECFDATRHVAHGDWPTAANEMLDSRWARQVGRRATELADIIRGLQQED